MANSFTPHIDTPPGTYRGAPTKPVPPAPDLTDLLALEAAVSSMGNWKAILLAQGEPTEKYEEALANARAAIVRLRNFVEDQA